MARIEEEEKEQVASDMASAAAENANDSGEPRSRAQLRRGNATKQPQGALFSVRGKLLAAVAVFVTVVLFAVAYAEAMRGGGRWERPTTALGRSMGCDMTWMRESWVEVNMTRFGGHAG